MTQLTEDCVYHFPSAVNMTLPAFAAKCHTCY